MRLKIPISTLLSTNHRNKSNFQVVDGKIINCGAQIWRKITSETPGFTPFGHCCTRLQITYFYPEKIDIVGLTKNLLDVTHSKDKLVTSLRLQMIISDESCVEIEEVAQFPELIPESNQLIYSGLLTPILINSIYGLSNYKTHLYRKPGTKYTNVSLVEPPEDTRVHFYIPERTRYDCDAPIYVAVSEFKLKPIYVQVERSNHIAPGEMEMLVYAA